VSSLDRHRERGEGKKSEKERRERGGKRVEDNLREMEKDSSANVLRLEYFNNFSLPTS
jgi:hypothetical protein